MSVTDASGNDIGNVSGLGCYNSLRYRGYYYDGETGLYYLQSRYYDPQVKRFINADDPPSWAKNEKYDKSKTAAQNAERVLNKKYGKNNWKKTTNSEYSKIKKWLQRSKGYK